MRRSAGSGLRGLLLGSLILCLAGTLACSGQPEWRRRAQRLLQDPHFPRPARGQRCLTDELLAAGLQAAVRSAAFDAVWDYGPLYGVGCPAEQTPACLQSLGRVGRERFPQLDLSVIAWNRAGCRQSVVKATVVFDRAHPDGVVGQHDPRTLQLTNIRFRQWDEARLNGGRFSLAGSGATAQTRVAPGSEVAWTAPYPEGSLLGQAPADPAAVDFMSPWPASVFKLMVATRLMQLLDSGKTADGEPVSLETPIPLPTEDLVGACPAEPHTLTLRQALETMLQWSGNCTTAGLVRFLHTRQEIVQSPNVDAQGYPLEPPLRSSLNETLRGLGLTTLQMNRTVERSGRWGNPNDNYESRTASVTNNFMTSWDTARLLWLFDELAEPPRWEVAPGRPVDARFVSPQRRALLRELLRDSYSGLGLTNNLSCKSATATADPEPPLEPGLPALMSAKWLDENGKKARTPFKDHPYPNVVDDLGPAGGDDPYSQDLSPCQKRAEVEFLNKPGLTNVAGSSVGIVRGIRSPGGRRRFSRHYIVSFFSSLGTRFADEGYMRSVGFARDANRHSRASTTQAIPRLGQNLDAWLALWLEDD